MTLSEWIAVGGFAFTCLVYLIKSVRHQSRMKTILTEHMVTYEGVVKKIVAEQELLRSRQHQTTTDVAVLTQRVDTVEEALPLHRRRA